MKLSKQFIRFCIVGAINTGVDVSIFLLLRHIGLAILVANICSTSVALGVSFMLNRRYTFKQVGGLSHAKIGLYAVITLFGLWVLQPIVITAFVDSLPTNPNINLVAKLAATVVTMVWNFTLYSKFVFPKANFVEESN